MSQSVGTSRALRGPVNRALRSVALLLAGCGSPPVAQVAIVPDRPEPVRLDATPVDAPDTTASAPIEAPTQRSDAACVPVTDCSIVARHRVGSAFARDHGYSVNARGLVASEYADWRPHGHADDTFFVEVSDSCDVVTGFYIESERRIWLPLAQSCGPETCARSTGWYFEAIEERHHARRFRPIGRNFFEDGEHVFDQNEVLHVDDVDRASFHACEAPPDDADDNTFYPSAEDARGVFGWGDCGTLVRATRVRIETE